MHYGRLIRFLVLLGIYIYLSPKDNPLDKVLAKKAKEIIKIVEKNVKGKKTQTIAFMAPTLNINNDLYVQEKGREIISTENLNSFDKDSEDFAILYQIKKAPLYGSVLIGRKKLVKSSVFTQEDLRSQRMIYVHHGKSVLKDELVFTLRDSDGRYAKNASLEKPGVLSIFIEPLNDPPVLVQNDGARVKEQSGVRINANLLNTKDRDNLESEIFYTLIEKPLHGSLAKNKRRLRVGDRFTQNDITQGKIIYVHETEENEIDQFKFSVEDLGKVQARKATRLRPATFFIDIEPVNDAPRLLIAKAPKVKEQGKILLSINNLKVLDVDNDDDEIRYIVVKTPSNGRLSKDGKQLLKGDSFTQEELLDNAIVYGHDGSNTVKDSLNFAVKDAGGLYALSATKKKVYQLKISISPINDRPKLQLNNKLTVNQYNRVKIRKENLQTRDGDNKSNEIVYKLLSAPLRGDLKLNNSILGTDDTFTQFDIDSGKIIYEHDDDNSARDEFSFSVSDKDGDSSIAASDEEPGTFIFEVNKAKLPPLPVIRDYRKFDRSIGISLGISGNGTTFTTAESVAFSPTKTNQTGRDLGVSFRTALSRNIALDIGLVQRTQKFEFSTTSGDINNTFVNQNYYAKLLTRNKKWNFGLKFAHKSFNFINLTEEGDLTVLDTNIPTVGVELINSNLFSVYDFNFAMRLGSEFYKGTDFDNNVSTSSSVNFLLGLAAEKSINNYLLIPEIIYTKQVIKTERSIQAERELLYKINLRYRL